MPVLHRVERIRSHDEVQFVVRILRRLQFGQRIVRIRRTFALQFDIADLEEFMVADGQFEHGQAVFSFGWRNLFLERVYVSRHEEHQVEIGLLTDLLRQDEMSVVKGVEASAQDPYPLTHLFSFRQPDCDGEFFELLIRHDRRSFAHDALRVLVLRERDDLTDVVCAE